MAYQDKRRSRFDADKDDFAPYGNPYMPGKTAPTGRTLIVMAVIVAAIFGALTLFTWTSDVAEIDRTIQTGSTNHGSTGDIVLPGASDG